MEEDHLNGGDNKVNGDKVNLNDGSIPLDTAKFDRAVWLMKCPPVVSKAWRAHSASSPPVAKVVVSLDPLQSDSDSAIKFTMEMAANDIENMPKSYSLNMFKDFVPMCIFSDSNQGKMSIGRFNNGVSMEGWLIPFTLVDPKDRAAPSRVASEGKVEYKFDMKPHHANLDDYRKFCRERTNKSMIKNRQTQVLDNDIGVLMRPMPSLMGFTATSSKDKKKAAPIKGPEIKRTRRDRGEIEDIMFKLFERQPNWTLKQLVQETDQPAQFLKEILNELCVYNKRGTNQGTYELKPEYKKSGEGTAGAV